MRKTIKKLRFDHQTLRILGTDDLGTVHGGMKKTVKECTGQCPITMLCDSSPFVCATTGG